MDQQQREACSAVWTEPAAEGIGAMRAWLDDPSEQMDRPARREVDPVLTGPPTTFPCLEPMAPWLSPFHGLF